MKTIAPMCLAGALIAAMALHAAQDPQDAHVPPEPGKEHQWLQQLIGAWENTTTMRLAADQEPIKVTSTERVRAVGAYWIIGESHADMDGTPFESVLTLGFDQRTQKFVGTWLASVSTELWSYQGTLDPTGKRLTLETEGPRPDDPAKRTKYHDVIEIHGPDHRVLTSSMLGDDGTWSEFVVIESRRK